MLESFGNADARGRFTDSWSSMKSKTHALEQEISTQSIVALGGSKKLLANTYALIRASLLCSYRTQAELMAIELISRVLPSIRTEPVGFFAV